MKANCQSLINKLPAIRGTYRENADLSKNTWFGVGGRAEILFRPADLEDLSFFLKHKTENIRITILGACSNVLISDKGIDGVTIKLGRNFSNFEIEDDKVTLGASCLNYNSALITRDHHLTGFEFLSGIPGSIGGSLAMNAGAYNEEISSSLELAEVIDSFGNIHYLRPKEIGFKYRGNNLPKDFIFTKGKFSLRKAELSSINSKLAEINHHKITTQPVNCKTGGSSFINPPGMKAWKLIDEAGCRGLEFGGAKISELHCNFIINTGKATAYDIENLGNIVKSRVFEKFGVNLEWEIKHIGKI